MQTNTDINAEGKKSATIIVKAILCDLDGTLIDSARCIDYAWQVWSTDRGLIPQEVIDGTHGLRTIEAIRMLLPDADPETIEREADLVEQLEVSCTQGLIPISGSHRMLGTLSPHHWAIVTSGSRKLASHRLNHVKLPIPKIFVTADDVINGKPHPEAYQTACGQLGLGPQECLVFEDCPNGIKAAKAAGMKVVAVTHAKADVHDVSHADYQVNDLSQIELRITPNSQLEITIKQ